MLGDVLGKAERMVAHERLGAFPIATSKTQAMRRPSPAS